MLAVVRGLALLVVACGPGLVQQETRDVGRTALVASSGNPGRIEDLLRVSVTNGGVYFADPACTFPLGEVPAAKFEAFARCLAALHLQPSKREDALGDVVVMTYEPGFE